MEIVKLRQPRHSENKTGFYLYCIAKAAEQNNIGSIRGIADAQLQTIQHRELSVIVSQVSRGRQQATRSNLLRHAEVLENIMQQTQILPIRFGIVAADEEEVINTVLKANYWSFHEILERLQGKKELGLKVLWQQQTVLNKLLEEDTELKNLRDSLAGRSDIAAYHEKIKLGRLLEAALRQYQEALRSEILDSLSELSEELRENKLLTENMILNSAFLVKSEDEEQFEERVNALGDKHEHLTFKYTNVAPPYNFVNLTIKL
ncbi:MAG TPA: GvpL/GvpF family gas vesicle protein [Oculatellaceae cyanobacterium]